ncbi:hypothetical protein D3C84_1126770 [compost metagenome]
MQGIRPLLAVVGNVLVASQSAEQNFLQIIVGVLARRRHFGNFATVGVQAEWRINDLSALEWRGLRELAALKGDSSQHRKKKDRDTHVFLGLN